MFGFVSVAVSVAMLAGANRAVTVQVPPAARLMPAQVSPVTVNAAAPVSVSVSAPVACPPTQITSDPPMPGHLLSGSPMCPCENVRVDVLACPCGLGDDYASCCGRLHAGAPAPTAESLMRSRYSAFAVGDAGYLLRTWHPSARPRTLSLDPARRWTRLAILETRDGGLFDATGTVQFRAMYLQQGQRGVLAETSRFVRQDRHWTYLGPIG